MMELLTVFTPLPAIYPIAIAKPIPNDRHGGPLVEPIGVVFHVQVGYGSLYHEFSTSTQVKSSHLWISRSGYVEQYVKLTDIAYAQALGNRYWVSVECEGIPEIPYTEEQIAAAGDFYAWASKYTGWPVTISDGPLTPGIGTHSMGGVPWGNHDCPGTIRAAQRTEIVLRAKGYQVDREVLQSIAGAVWGVRPVDLTNNDGSTTKVRQPDLLRVLEEAYRKAGDCQARLTRVESLLEAIVDHIGMAEEPVLPNDGM